jgi:hypothetical protein
MISLETKNAGPESPAFFVYGLLGFLAESLYI